MNVTVDLTERDQMTTTTTPTTTSTPPTDSTASTTPEGSTGTEPYPDEPVRTPGFDALAAVVALVGVALLTRSR